MTVNMKKIVFRYPFMVFEKCECSNQVPIREMKTTSSTNSIKLKYSLNCPVCGKDINRIINVQNNITELTDFINAFKVIPAIKDELAIIKLDTVKAKLKDNGKLNLYGNYSHLRFWDNKIQNDIIKIGFEIED
jgi:hypothetical protein